MPALLSQTRSSNTSGEAPQSRTTQIVCLNEQLQIEPQCAGDRGTARTIKRVAAVEHMHGYQLQAQRESLLAPSMPRPNAGLLFAVCRLLAQAGYGRIRLHRSSDPPRNCPRQLKNGAMAWAL